MEKIGWRFPPLSGGTRQSYTSNDIEGFKGEEIINNLTRETCQNSLDAKNKNINKPVKVVYELKHISTSLYEAIKEYQKYLKGCYSYWNADKMDPRLEEFLSKATSAIKKESIPVLIISDYNTSGLCGSGGNKLFSPWEALTSSDGMSVKTDKDSSGSYGIGKNAPFACSSLSMVFYNTKATDGGKAFIGVARLATLNDEEGRPTQRIGRYQNNDNENEKWRPIYDYDNDSFRDLFVRNNYGTDVIIVGFNQEKNWTKNIIKAVLKNFFISICEQKLIVELKNNSKPIIINNDTLPIIIENYKDDPKIISTYQMYKAFTTPDKHQQLSILENEENDVDVYIKEDSLFKRTIGNFRANGMLIKTYYKRIFQHYAAVVLIRGAKLSELLKETEPPKHDKWDYKLINDSTKKEQAKKAIKSIDEQVYTLLTEQSKETIEASTDAIGVGEYLPSEINETSSSEDTDILNVDVEITDIKKPNTKREATIKIKQNDSKKRKTAVSNAETKKSNRKYGAAHLIKSPNENRSNSSNKRNITTITPILDKQRAYLKDPDTGLYKIIVQSPKTYEQLYIKCFAHGEDGKSDPLKIDKFIFNDSSINISDNGFEAGPLKIEAKKTTNFFVRFIDKGKFQLILELTAVINK